MKLTLEAANDQLMRTLREVKPVLKKSGRDLVRSGARLAMTKAIEITPPMSAARGPTKDTQRFAERLIASDVRRVFATVDYAYGTIQSPAAASAFWFLLKTGGRKGRAAGIESAREILRDKSYNQRLRNAPIVATVNPQLHADARRRGRVPKSAHVQQIALRPTSIDRLIKQRQRNIGFLAAGWLEAVDQLKVTRVPAWIKRHKGRAPSAMRIEDNGDVFKLHMINRVGYGAAAQLARIVPIALSAAAGGMRAQAKKITLKAMQRAGFTLTTAVAV